MVNGLSERPHCLKQLLAQICILGVAKGDANSWRLPSVKGTDVVSLEEPVGIEWSGL